MDWPLQTALHNLKEILLKVGSTLHNPRKTGVPWTKLEILLAYGVNRLCWNRDVPKSNNVAEVIEVSRKVGILSNLMSRARRLIASTIFERELWACPVYTKIWRCCLNTGGQIGIWHSRVGRSSLVETSLGRFYTQRAFDQNGNAHNGIQKLFYHGVFGDLNLQVSALAPSFKKWFKFPRESKHSSMRSLKNESPIVTAFNIQYSTKWQTAHSFLVRIQHREAHSV